MMSNVSSSAGEQSNVEQGHPTGQFSWHGHLVIIIFIVGSQWNTHYQC